MRQWPHSVHLAPLCQVPLVGRLATDVDLQSVTGGFQVASFIMAMDRNGEEADLPLLRTQLGSF